MMNTVSIVKKNIPKIQEQIELLQKCLYSANSKDEMLAEFIEIAHYRRISLNVLLTDLQSLKQLFDKLLKLGKKIQTSCSENQLSLLEFVKFSLFIKEAVTKYDYLIDNELIRYLTDSNISLYRNILDIETNTSMSELDNVIVESVKHELKALLETSVRKNILSESEISDLNLGNITPQLSEDMLIFLSTKKRWQPVYDRLAKS